MPRVVLGRPQHVADRFGLRATKMNGYIEGCVRQNKIISSTQWIDCGLKAVKTDDNTESRVGHKEDSWKEMDGDAGGYNQEGTSARNEQTPV